MNENNEHDVQSGLPLILVEEMDAEHGELGRSDQFWRFIQQRRSEETMSRMELEEQLKQLHP